MGSPASPASHLHPEATATNPNSPRHTTPPRRAQRAAVDTLTRRLPGPGKHRRAPPRHPGPRQASIGRAQPPQRRDFTQYPPPVNTSAPSIPRRRWRSCPPDLSAGFTARSHDDLRDQGDRSCTLATAPRAPFLAAAGPRRRVHSVAFPTKSKPGEHLQPSRTFWR